MWKKALIVVLVLMIGLFLFLEFYKAPLPENHGKLDVQLYLSDQEDQPLVVGFGGSEGGNAWTIDYWKDTRDKFLEEGYAFLAIGYFGMDNTPQYLDRISLDAIHDTIIKVAQHPKIDSDKIALIGASKGGELVLNLSSRYDDIDATVAIVPAHVSFPALSIMANTSSWSYKNEELPYVRAPYKIIIPALKGDLHTAHAMMLENKLGVENATISVENISGAILLLSAKEDQQWSSTMMCEAIVERLKDRQFQYDYKHIAYDGNHYEPLKHFHDVLHFLEKHLKK